MTICYAIKDWGKHFENSESRKYKSLTWVPMKNKHDGKGYRRVCQHPKSIQVFCAWVLLVQVASKMPVRGLLRDDDGPLTASDLSAKTGLPEVIFEEAFKVLTDSKIGWLERVKTEDAGKSPKMPGETHGEQNGTEQTRIDQQDTPPKSADLNGSSGDSQGGGWAAMGHGAARGDMGHHPTIQPSNHPTASGPLLTLDGLSRMARACLDSQWRWDNCKVTPEMFTVGSLVAVLRPFAGRVPEARLVPGFIEAVRTAHARCVDRRNHDNPIQKPGALAITCLREELEKTAIHGNT